jgi:hypothetical protein
MQEKWPSIMEFSVRVVAQPTDDMGPEDIKKGADMTYRMISHEGHPVLVAENAPEELISRLLAAVASVTLRLKSVDYVMRTYIKNKQ